MERALSHKAYDYLLDQIISGKLTPGMLLNRRDLAKELGMSTAPVVEALVRLQEDGFVTNLPRTGTIIAHIRPEDLRSYVILREAIECQAARLYHGKLVTKQYDSLLVLAQRFDQVGNLLQKLHLEYEFHCRLVALIESEKVNAMFAKIMRLILYNKMHRCADIADETEYSNHIKLLGMLKTNDRAEAEDIMRRHINSDIYAG